MAVWPRLLVGAWLALPSVAVRLPALGQLIEAVHGGNEVEIERLGRRLGAGRLTRAALSGTHVERLAALRALTLVDGAWFSLPSLSSVLGDADREVADTAAAAVREIALSLTLEEVFAEEIPPDILRSSAQSLWRAALDATLPDERRVASLSAANALAHLARSDRVVALDREAPLLQLLGDGNEALRRASGDAIDLQRDAPLLERALSDGEDPVAATAGAALCREIPPTGPTGAAGLAASALTAPTRERLRVLATRANDLTLGERLDLIPCLRVFASPLDRKTLDALANSPEEAIKHRARAFGGR